MGAIIWSIFTGLIGSVVKLIFGKSKDKTIEKQNQDIVDLTVENIEHEAEKKEQGIKNEYDKDKASAGEDLDARLDNINKHNP